MPQTVRPVTDVATTGVWTPSTGSSLSLMLDEPVGTGDTTFVESPANAGPNTATLALGSASTPQAGTVTLRVRSRAPVLSGGPSGKSILTPSDFSFLGWHRLPANQFSSGTSWEDGYIYFDFVGHGGLTGRYVGGDLHLFTTMSEGSEWRDPVIEMVVDQATASTVTGASRLGTYKVWGNIYKDGGGNALRTPINGGGGNPNTRGLHWDGEKLLWSWGPNYDGSYDRSIGATTFSGTSSFTSYGTWRTSEHAKRTCGYMTEIPEWFATAHLGGKRVGVGAPITSVNSMSPWGAWLSAMDSTNLLSVPASSNGTISDIAITGMQRLIGWEQAEKMPREATWATCGWDAPVTYSCAEPRFLVENIPHVSDIDTFGGCSWIDMPTKHGLVYFGAMAEPPDSGYTYPNGDPYPHVWYAPGTLGTCCHGHENGSGGTGGGMSGNSPGPNCPTHVPQMWIFNPDDLVAAASNSALANTHTPTSSHVQMRTQFGTQFPATTTAYKPFGESWFDATTNKLYLLTKWVDGNAPAIAVFQVS